MTINHRLMRTIRRLSGRLSYISINSALLVIPGPNKRLSTGIAQLRGVMVLLDPMHRRRHQALKSERDQRASCPRVMAKIATIMTKMTPAGRHLSRRDMLSQYKNSQATLVAGSINALPTGIRFVRVSMVQMCWIYVK